MSNVRRAIVRAGKTDATFVTRVVASTAVVDRAGDVVDQSWELDNFRANPVILWAHNPSIPPVGRATSVEVEGAGSSSAALVASIEWDVGEHNPLGTTIGNQFARGVLSAVSVGFKPGALTSRAALDEGDPRYGKTGNVLLNNELYEVSGVTIPANPEALALRTLQAEDIWEDVDARIRAALSDIMGAAVKAAVLDAVRRDAEVKLALAGALLAEPAGVASELDHLWDADLAAVAKGVAAERSLSHLWLPDSSQGSQLGHLWGEE